MNLRINDRNEKIAEKLKGSHSKTFNAILKFLDKTTSNSHDLILLLEKIEIILYKENMSLFEFANIIDSKPMQKSRIGVMVESLLKLELGDGDKK